MNLPITFKITKTSIDNLMKYFKLETIRKYCTSCPNFNKNWSCPNYTFDEKDYITNYNFAYVISSKLYFKDIQDTINDLKTKNKSDKQISYEIYLQLRKNVDKKMFDIEQLFPNTTILLGGSCNKCAKCTRLENKPCLHPENIRYSLESLGFEVSSITKNLLNEEIQFTKDKLPEYTLSVSAILSKDNLDINKIQKLL
ncbi:DUF2284 domain-containing protein [Haloimpatiens sp. FM7330]|uniref:DUF2284 domain-containing protein n=1 Tax=Haloimpatiens sp. FM7330 TaxID=3298610 RepID=UPI0036360D2C